MTRTSREDRFEQRWSWQISRRGRGSRVPLSSDEVADGVGLVLFEWKITGQYRRGEEVRSARRDDSRSPS